MDDKDTIYRQDAIDAINDVLVEYIPVLPHWLERIPLECALKIKALPPVQPKRKKGQWIDKSNGIEGAWNYCSVCGEQAIDLYDFCPNCGADMRGETDGQK